MFSGGVSVKCGELTEASSLRYSRFAGSSSETLQWEIVCPGSPSKSVARRNEAPEGQLSFLKQEGGKDSAQSHKFQPKSKARSLQGKRREEACI